MALPTFSPEKSEQPKQQSPFKRKKRDSTHGRHHKQTQKPHKASSSWNQFKNLLRCKQIEGSRVHDPSKNSKIKYSGPYTYRTKLGSTCGSICSFRDVAHRNTRRVVHRADNSPESGSSAAHHDDRILTRKPGQHGSSSSRSNGSGSYSSLPSSTTSFRAMQFRKLSGCYECRMIVDPRRYPISPRICACSQCGEVFPKLENLELHQAVRHAVSELGPEAEDSGRNIVEIIFKSSWLKKDGSVCKIERILKVHNTQRTIQRFEDCRDSVKVRALQSARKDARCAADGNELLRFHCTALTCSLGARGSSSLCSAVPGCGVCTIIRQGFGGKSSAATSAGGGIWTTASSGRAHDSLLCTDDRRAMLVCRVIAGRVKRLEVVADPTTDPSPNEEKGTAVLDGGACSAYDSLAVNSGVYSNVEELVVFDPRAILPCFAVIYKVLES